MPKAVARLSSLYKRQDSLSAALLLELALQPCHWPCRLDCSCSRQSAKPEYKLQGGQQRAVRLAVPFWSAVQGSVERTVRQNCFAV